jgi:predicted nucleotidyltransferase
MDRDSAIRTLKAHEAELRALGVKRLSLFGSLARGEAGPESDVDLAVTLDPERKIGLFRYAALREQLADMLGREVDMVSEPVSKARLQARIDQDRVHVF